MNKLNMGFALFFLSLILTSINTNALSYCEVDCADHFSDMPEYYRKCIKKCLMKGKISPLSEEVEKQSATELEQEAGEIAEWRQKRAQKTAQ